MATIPIHSDGSVAPPIESLALLRLERTPQEILAEAQQAAAALIALVESKKKVVLNGKTYLTFEDWLTVARFYGITVAARATNYVERGRDVQGYECHAEAILVSTGQVIGAAQAECLDDEKNWNTRAVYRDGKKVGEEKVPLFQLRSMAQTRAQAKALRSILSWVVVLAGYAPTPAEEMLSEQNGQNGTPIASRLECKPLDAGRVKYLCQQIATAGSIDELKKRYFAAGAEAKAANDRAALDAIKAAKDARKAAIR